VAVFDVTTFGISGNLSRFLNWIHNAMFFRLSTALALLVSSISLSLNGCSDSESAVPIPESHPAFAFYQIAKRGRTTIEACKSHGGIEIYPNDYRKLENLDQGIITLRQKSTGKKYLCVSFAEGGVLLTLKTCCWETDN